MLSFPLHYALILSTHAVISTTANLVYNVVLHCTIGKSGTQHHPVLTSLSKVYKVTYDIQGLQGVLSGMCHAREQ